MGSGGGGQSSDAGEVVGRGGQGRVELSSSSASEAALSQVCECLQPAEELLDASPRTDAHRVARMSRRAPIDR